MNSCQFIVNASRNNTASNYDRVRVIFLSEEVIRESFSTEICKHRTKRRPGKSHEDIGGKSIPGGREHAHRGPCCRREQPSLNNRGRPKWQEQRW